MVRTFLVECYVPGVDEPSVGDAGRRVRDALAALGDGAKGVAYTGATLVPADEVVFHAFTAPDAASVERVSRAADIPYERIVEAVSVGAEPSPNAIAGARRRP